MLSSALCGGTHRPESQRRWPRWRCRFQQVCVYNIRQHLSLNEITVDKRYDIDVWVISLYSL